MGRTRTLEDQLPAGVPEVDLRMLSEGLADEDPAVREDCAQQLAGAKTPDAAPFLRHALDDDAEQVRMWGAYGLGLLAREEDREELSRAAQHDESPLVRVWATFGLAQLGDPTAAPALVAFLDLPDLELKSNAADALLSLEDPSQVRPLLDKRLQSADDRKRVWTAAVLHRLGHKDAFALWRDGLVNPETRVDAAMVAPHLKTIDAARELVRVVAELSEDELDAPVPQANELPLAELMTSPLLDLDLGALLLAAKRDAELRSNLLRLVLRSPVADPEVLGQLYDYAGQLPPDGLGKDVAEILAEHSPAERLALLSRMIDFAAGAVPAAVESLSGEDRDALFDAVAEAAGAPTEDNAHVAPVLALLRTTAFASQFDDLPPAPWGEEPQTDLGVETVDDDESEEGDVSELIERLAAGDTLSAEERKLAEDTLAELGMTAEEFVESLHAEIDDDIGEVPPEPEQVAARALALGAVLERAQVERDVIAKKLTPKDARASLNALTKWLEDEGVMDVATSLEADLLAAEPGDWLEEDLELAMMSVDALAMLLWAAGQAPAPAADKPASISAALQKVPLREPTAKFIERVAMKDPEELERQRELWETYLWRCEQESTARLALAGEDVEFEIDVEAIREELEKDGFDAKAAKAKGGQAGLTAEALRFLGRKAAEKLAAQKQLVLAGGDFPFQGRALSALDDDTLNEATAMAHERHRALSWVLVGGEWDDLSVDELSDDEEFVEDDEDALFDDEEPIDEDFDDGSGEGG